MSFGFNKDRLVGEKEIWFVVAFLFPFTLLLFRFRRSVSEFERESDEAPSFRSFRFGVSFSSFRSFRFGVSFSSFRFGVHFGSAFRFLHFGSEFRTLDCNFDYWLDCATGSTGGNAQKHFHLCIAGLSAHGCDHGTLVRIMQSYNHNKISIYTLDLLLNLLLITH